MSEDIERSQNRTRTSSASAVKLEYIHTPSVSFNDSAVSTHINIYQCAKTWWKIKIPWLPYTRTGRPKIQSFFQCQKYTCETLPKDFLGSPDFKEAVKVHHKTFLASSLSKGSLIQRSGSKMEISLVFTKKINISFQHQLYSKIGKTLNILQWRL